jgi:hypothetical protein
MKSGDSRRVSKLSLFVGTRCVAEATSRGDPRRTSLFYSVPLQRRGFERHGVVYSEPDAHILPVLVGKLPSWSSAPAMAVKPQIDCAEEMKNLKVRCNAHQAADLNSQHQVHQIISSANNPSRPKAY